jgi:hypothetical protein
VPESRYRASPRWLATAAGGLSFITDTETGEIHEFNATGRLVYESAAAGASFAQVVDRLARRHPDIPRAEVESDAGELVQDLLRRGALAPLVTGAAQLGAGR